MVALVVPFFFSLEGASKVDEQATEHVDEAVQTEKEVSSMKRKPRKRKLPTF